MDGAGKWSRAPIELQLQTWFVGVPDFLLTFDAHYASMCSDAEFCALVEHELIAPQSRSGHFHSSLNRMLSSRDGNQQ